MLKKIKCWYNRRSDDIQKSGLALYFNSGGYILIIVLLVTTLLASISAEFIVVAQTNAGYFRKMDEKTRALYISKSGVELAKVILAADKSGASIPAFSGKNSDRNIDTYNDIWGVDFPELPVDEGSVKISISDENSKINLSVLGNEAVDKTPYYAIVQRFFMNMGLLPDFADVILDWVDIDSSRSPYGAESQDYYLTLPSPYSAKNSAMDSIDELLMLKSMTPEIYYGLGGGNSGNERYLVENNKGDTSLNLDKMIFGNATPKKDDAIKSNFKIGREKSRRLFDYFRAYGFRPDYMSEFNKININTASFRVLSALTDSMTDDKVTELINRRQKKPFTSVDEVADLIADETIRKNIITVRSYIFKIEITGTVKNTSVKTTVYYNRDTKKYLYWSEE